MDAPQSEPGQAETIKGNRVQPPAVPSDAPLTIEGYGTIPPITDFVPDFKAPGLVIQVGVFVPRGVPGEVVARLEDIWANQIATSEQLKAFAASRGSIVCPVCGEEAMTNARVAVAEAAWRMYDTGAAKVSPGTLGIARP